MTTHLPRDVWLPIPTSWRWVCAGDVFVAPNGDTGETELWRVDTITDHGTDVLVTVNGHAGPPYRIDFDTPVQVLRRVQQAELTDAAAAEIVRRGLASHLIKQQAPHMPAA